MSGQSPPQHEQHPSEQPSNVRHIPIFVEGRDEPVINKNVDHGAHYAEPKPTYAPPPPHVDREQYFADDSPAGFHHPPNFGRAFGTPFNKGFRQGPQPFVQQKAYPQAAQFARGASPARSQSPKPPPHEEHFVKVPVHHEHAAPKPEQPPSRAQPKPQQQPPPPPPPPPQQAPPQQAPPQPKPQPSPNDPITQILSIQTDVLNLMSEVENFTGSKKDKRYLFLDEMLTRNLIKLDNIETDGKENIRQARKEAIRCIQKCIAVLEAKAEKGSAALNEEMKEGEQKNAENGEVEMKETKEEAQPTADAKEEQKQETEVNKEIQAVDTRTEPEKTEATPEVKPENKPATEEKSSPKKKVVKKRDKSKDKDAAKDSNKAENVDNKDKKNEEMQVDEKGDKEQSGNSQMEVDGASASQ